MRKHVTILVVLTWIVSGCAVNRHLSFAGKVAGPGYLTGKPVTVAVQDRRPAVLNGKEKSSWCGHVYSTVQIAYNVQTGSGRSLAEEFTDVITATYSRQGAPAGRLAVHPEATADSLVQAFRVAPAGLLLHFEVREWETKAIPGFSSVRYEHLYDLKLTLLDERGDAKTTSSVRGTVTEKGGGFTSVGRMQDIADGVLRTQVEMLFNEPSVRNLLAKP